MRRLARVVLFLLFVSPLSAFGATYDLGHPGLTLLAPSGPFGYGGRGIVFTANENFTMSSFGMDLSFPGTLDFAVEVYAVEGTSRGALLSNSSYPGLTDDDSAYFTLNHSHTFEAGQTYELMFRFSDPGVIFPHYNFDNDTLNPANGYAVGTLLTVLDGSDYDAAEFGNSWLAAFELNTGALPPPPPETAATAVPTLSEWAIVTLGTLLAAGAVFGFRRRNS